MAEELSWHSVLAPVIWVLMNLHRPYTREPVSIEVSVEVGTRIDIPTVTEPDLIQEFDYLLGIEWR